MSGLLDRAVVDRAFSGFPNSPILIALSGGGDSTALLHLMLGAYGPARLRVAVVDHGLREGSAIEARQAADHALRLGVAARVATLAWASAGPHGQEAARKARYRVLCAQARKHGAAVIALAHTRDDQAETVLLRAAAGSNWRGLSGMRAFAPAPVWPEGRGHWLMRPLLAARRTKLRTYLSEKGAAWIEDASNANAAYARVRARARLAEMEREGLDPMRLAALAEKLGIRAAALDAAAAELIARAVRFEQDKLRLDLAAWRGAAGVRQRALGVLIASVSGEAQESAARGLEDIEARLTRPEFTGATLGGARLRPLRGAVRLERDKGAVRGRADGRAAIAPLALAPDAERVWDGRLAVRASQSGWTLRADGEGRPRVVNETQTLTLKDAEASGILAFRWLLSDHVAHLLAVFSA